MGLILTTSLSIFFRVLSFIVIIDVLLSYFMSPYHPIRSFLDRIVEPLLNPIRRVVPAIAGLDFSPVVLIIVLQILESVTASLASGL
ncbi:MAG: YggT family protein [Leptolinea sp.]|jgi:YggT family protein|nr:YggT family protein [Leptolinea sp.]